MLENWQTKNKITLIDTCRFTVLKDLCAVCCTSLVGYNRNFSDCFEDLKISNCPNNLRTSKKIFLFMKKLKPRQQKKMKEREESQKKLRCF